MKIERIQIENFRGFRELDFELNDRFNLIVGENGSGKTAILEALTVAAGSFFLGLNGVQSRSIRKKDIRLFKSPEGTIEIADRAIVEAEGIVSNQRLAWRRVRSFHSSKTTYGEAKAIRQLSGHLHAQLKDQNRTSALDLPLLAYYSTARLWKERQEYKQESEHELSTLPSRYRGYKDALNVRSNFNIMLNWFKGKFAAALTKGKPTFQLEVVRNAITQNVPDASELYWEFDSDKRSGLYIGFKSGEELPFDYLSDGYRNLMAIFADLAYRCVTLNPHFGMEATQQTKGMVLIDELDLHLHPGWQKGLIHQLKASFPNIQFVATTHSPFLIQETRAGELIRIRERLNLLSKPYADNVAYIAFLEQKRALAEQQLNS